MKQIKTILCLLIMNFFALASFAQGTSKTAGATCNCTGGQSSCNSTCTFSDCCVCWSPSTQNGACGCYWGVASCKTSKINADKGLVSNDNIFGEVNPEANVVFHFAKFRSVFTFFDKLKISRSNLESIVNTLTAKYKPVDDNARLQTDEFQAILNEYGRLIQQLTDSQKSDFNIFIKTL